MIRGRTDIPPVLNGLWWNLAPGRDARIMVANMSPMVVTADVFLDYGSERHPSAPLNFSPHELKVLSIIQLLGEQNASAGEAPEGGITILQRGGVPKLIAQGKMLDSVTGFSTTLHFPLPELEHSSALHADGIPFAKPSKDSPFAGMGYFTPHVVLRNLGPTPQTATVTVEYPTAQGWDSTEDRAPSRSAGAKSSPPAAPDPAELTRQTPLAPVVLQGYSTQDISLDPVLSELPQPVPYASIRIQYSGTSGSMMAEVSSVDQRQDLVVDAKLQNERNGWAGSGANPWHLDSETESFVFLTDMSDKPARIGFKVSAKGTVYYLTRLQLVPHETRVINLRQLRDARQPDFKGNTIPAGATDGSVLWTRFDNVPVMGRVAVINRRGGLASAYDCCTCSCPLQYGAMYISPGSVSIAAGQQSQLTAYEGSASCNSSSYWTVTNSANWVSNPSIDSVNVSGLVTGVGSGTDSVEAWIGSVCVEYVANGEGECGCSDVAEAQAYCQVTVKCGDVRDQIIQEYVTYSIGWQPICGYFTTSAHSVYFTFQELNSGDYTWALVKEPMTVASSSGYGLDDWRVQYGSARTMNSAYRNPKHNAAVGGASNSRHLFGNAGDLNNNSYSTSCGTGSACLNEWQKMQDAAIAANRDYLEPSNGPCGYKCVHADWRNHDINVYSQ
jgi:hypothetical protein